MAHFHLVRGTRPHRRGDRSNRGSDARVTVVLLDGAAAPSLPAGVAVRRLAPGDLDYAGLLDLIFAHDHVVTW